MGFKLLAALRPPQGASLLGLASLLLGLASPLGQAAAGGLHFCAHGTELSASQKDTLFRFSGVIKAELEQSGQRVALVARSGLDLNRFNIRYSHSGVSLKANETAPWAIRQLYFACDEGMPRIFDEGMSGFLLGTDNPHLGYLSVVFLPEAEAAQLERAALDRPTALQLLGPHYSANAYAYGLDYQNCNQWLIEMLATAWGAPADAGMARASAQQWLKARDYQPSRVEVDSRLLWMAGSFVPWLHDSDHPRANLDQRRYEVSMPAAIEAFVQANIPGASRVEFCHRDRQVVIHRGWDAIAENCEPGEGDTVIALD